MHPYRSKSGKISGVTAYETGSNFILVQFNYENTYKYTYRSAGKTVIEKMKTLALSQQGLGTFISQNKPPYELILGAAR